MVLQRYNPRRSTRNGHVRLATIPLINMIHTDGTSQVWYADDASGGGKLSSIKAWWDSLTTHGPHYGYLPNAKKSWLVIKPEVAYKARSLICQHKHKYYNGG